MTIAAARDKPRPCPPIPAPRHWLFAGPRRQDRQRRHLPRDDRAAEAEAGRAFGRAPARRWSGGASPRSPPIACSIAASARTGCGSRASFMLRRGARRDRPARGRRGLCPALTAASATSGLLELDFREAGRMRARLLRPRRPEAIGQGAGRFLMDAGDREGLGAADRALLGAHLHARPSVRRSAFTCARASRPMP